MLAANTHRVVEMAILRSLIGHLAQWIGCNHASSRHHYHLYGIPHHSQTFYPEGPKTTHIWALCFLERKHLAASAISSGHESHLIKNKEGLCRIQTKNQGSSLIFIIGPALLRLLSPTSNNQTLSRAGRIATESFRLTHNTTIPFAPDYNVSLRTRSIQMQPFGFGSIPYAGLGMHPS